MNAPKVRTRLGLFLDNYLFLPPAVTLMRTGCVVGPAFPGPCLDARRCATPSSAETRWESVAIVIRSVRRLCASLGAWPAEHVVLLNLESDDVVKFGKVAVLYF